MAKPIGSVLRLEPTLKGDSAKQTISEDEFGLINMVAGLAETLTRRVAADGYVLGIEGSWGSGKSTLVNFIAEEMKRAPEHHVIRFEPWLIGEKNALLSFFFGQLASKVDEIKIADIGWWHFSRWRLRRLTSRLATKIRKYGEYVGVLATPVGALAAADPTGTIALSAVGLQSISGISKVFGSGPLSLEKLKFEITSELLRLKSSRPDIRFTVIVDDTDRLEPSEAIEMLRLVRKVADFPLTTYVICFDKNILSMQVAKALKLDDGHHFIEKIFQDIITVPPQEPFALRRYLKRQLQQTFPDEMSIQSLDDTEFEYRKHLVLDQWTGEFIKTPRDVVRLHEAIKFSWPYVPEGSDFFDFVWLQLIKLKAHKLYDWTQAYLANVGAYRDGGRAGDREPKEEAEKLNAIMKEFNWADKGYRSGIGTIVPGVSSFVLDGDKRKVFDFERDELAKFERTKRLGSPSHWRQYFAFDMPSYAIKDDEISSFRLLLKEDASKAADMLRKFFERPHDRRGHFVDLLLDRLSDASPDSFSPGEIHGMLSAFADTMDHIAAESGEFTTSGRSEIWRKATRLLNQSAAGDFKNVITNGKSINWLANVVRDQGFAHGLPSGHKDYPDNQWLTRAQLDEAIQVVTKRFRELDANTIFQLPSPLDLLFCWYQLGDKTEVRKFFTDAIQSDESFLYALNALRGWASSSDIGIHHPLHKDYVAYFMNADDAKGRLERLADPMAPSSALRDKAKELLSEWADKLVN